MGRLIWLMGPSGSGKDSLLSALRQREHSQLLVAHRYITRAANAGSENHIALSEQEFLPAPGRIAGAELARQRLLLRRRRRDRPVAARRV
jgi:phosphonate metabolism protein PhnN/1,5-bisphosphokinase (PRPP-forming)